MFRKSDTAPTGQRPNRLYGKKMEEYKKEEKEIENE
jgi:hypothetical protein